MQRETTILLVEADLEVRQALREVLATENYEVVLATSSEEAAQQLQERGPGAIDALLLDLANEPDNGCDSFLRLTGVNSTLPFIVITSHRDQAVPVFGVRCAAVMPKPLDLPWLCETLRGLTARHETSIQPEVR